MSKKRKFLIGLGVFVLAAGVSAVASVPSTAGLAWPDTARVAQAAPGISG
jgi:hypothetical protein